MNLVRARDILDKTLDIIDVLSFCLCEDMPNKFVDGNTKLYFLLEVIEEKLNHLKLILEIKEKDEDEID